MDEKNLAILRKLKEQLLAAEPKPEVIYPFKSSSLNNSTTGRKQLYIHDEKMMQNNQIKTNVKKCVKSNTQSREENAHLDKKKKEKTTEKKEYYRSAQEMKNAELLKKSKQARQKNFTPKVNPRGYYGWYHMMHDAPEQEPHYEPHTFSGGMVRPK